MTTIVAALNRVARECSLDTPSNWITNSKETYVEIRDDFLPEVIDDLLRRVEWGAPIGKTTAITGDGTEDYDLPSNFYRLKKTDAAVYETQNVRRFCTPVVDDGTWTHIKELGTGAGTRYFRLEGYEGNWEILFYPTPSASESVTVHYVSDVWMKSSGGTEGNAFTAIDDVLLFPRRLVETGILYRWRRRKGLDYAAFMQEHELILAQISNRTNVRNKVHMGGVPTVSPWQIPVPDFIPSS